MKRRRQAGQEQLRLPVATPEGIALPADRSQELIAMLAELLLQAAGAGARRDGGQGDEREDH
jgi:hypothetical protein